MFRDLDAYHFKLWPSIGRVLISRPTGWSESALVGRTTCRTHHGQEDPVIKESDLVKNVVNKGCEQD